MSRQVTLQIKLLSDMAQKLAQEAQSMAGTNKRLSNDMLKSSAAAKKLSDQLGRIGERAEKAGKPLEHFGEGFGTRMGRRLGSVIKQMKELKITTDGVTKAFKNAAGVTLKVGTMAAAGTVGAAAVLKPQVSFDRQMSLNAGIMYGTKDANGRLYTREEANAQKAGLTAQIDKAVAGGVGTRDQGRGAQKELLASGQFNGEQGLRRIDALLPNIMKAAAASGTDASEMAQAAVGAANKGLNDAQINAFLGKMMLSDNAGAFGSQDMAKWIPKWLAGAGDALQGEHAVDSLLVHAQTVRKTAGTSDEAGNNLDNVLAFAASNKADGDLKKKYGIDRQKEMNKNMSNGDDYLTAYARTISKAFENDKGYQDLKKKASAAGTDKERAQVVEEMAGYTKTGIIGDNVTDIQSRKALIAIMNEMDKPSQLKADIAKEDGTFVTDAYNQRIKGDAQSSVDSVANASDGGVNAALTALTPTINTAAEAFSNFATAHPLATGMTEVAGGAVVAGGGALLLQQLLGNGNPLDWFRKRKGKGKNKPDGGLPDLPVEIPGVGGMGGVQDVFVTNMGAGGLGGIDTSGIERDGKGKGKGKGGGTAAEVEGKAGKAVGKLGKVGKFLGAAEGVLSKLGVVAAVAGAGIETYQVLTDEHATKGEKTQGVTAAAGGLAGGIAGAEAGAAAGALIGSVIPVLGTAVGAAVGGLIGGGLGYWGGHAAGDTVGGYARDAIDGPQAVTAGGLGDALGGAAGIQSAVAAGVSQGMVNTPAAPNLSQMPAYLTAPALAAIPPPVQKVEVSIKDGKLAVTVAVSPTSELLNAVARASTPTVALTGTVSGGSTNPASYGGSPIR